MKLNKLSFAIAAIAMSGALWLGNPACAVEHRLSAPVEELTPSFNKARDHIDKVIGKKSNAVKLDLSDQKQYDYILEHLRLTGTTREKSPQLYRMLEQSKKEHTLKREYHKMLKSGVAKDRAISLLSANNNEQINLARILTNNKPKDIFHRIQDLDAGKNVKTKKNEMLAKARTSITGKMTYTYTSAVVMGPHPDDPKKMIKLGHPGGIHAFAGNANNVVAYSPVTDEIISAVYDDGDLLTVESIVIYEDADGNKGHYVTRSKKTVSEYKAKKKGESSNGELDLIAPVDKNEDNKIQVCLNRDHGDCDYEQMYPANTPNDKLLIKLPFQGTITIPHKVKKIYKPSEVPADSFVTGKTNIWISTNTGEHAQLVDPATGKTFVDFMDPPREVMIDGRPHTIISWDIPREQAVFGTATMYKRFKNVEWEIHIIADVNLMFYEGIEPFTVDITADNSQTPSHQWVIESRMPFMYFEYSCMAKGTLITMADGTQKPIEQVMIGDQVQANGLVMSVEDTSIGNEVLPMVRINTKDGKSVLLTETHPVLTKNRGIVWAQEVRQGDQLITQQGTTSVIKVANENYNDTVHNLKLAKLEDSKVVLATDSKAVFANGLLVGGITMQADYSFKDQQSLTVEQQLQQIPERWHQDFLNNQ
ncbi:Hint domain-containing protein [Zooshikella ganghwensis]|uniref:Hint domain-containing protein n=1 Tax=Zooshikella ganghwensis TaxID=202772 RepID=UPI0004185D18|nr:Hint domain-containing protein [Zooshikella ganghwensis]